MTVGVGVGEGLGETVGDGETVGVGDGFGVFVGLGFGVGVEPTNTVKLALLLFESLIVKTVFPIDNEEIIKMFPDMFVVTIPGLE